MTWFEDLTGFPEKSPEYVHQNLVVERDRMKSLANGGDWRCGTLETPTLSKLRERIRNASYPRSTTKVREIVANVQQLHCDEENAGAMFQVASQFNLLEMAHPDATPEEGVGIYQHDFTQGPACAIAAGAGTIFRNYFLPINGETGQTSEYQINCLADIGTKIGNSDHRLWDMVNGYALPSSTGLDEIRRHLERLNETDLDELRGLLRIGIHRNTQVTLNDCSHVVSQCYCSAMPVAYTRHSSSAWAQFATLILEAAYEATLCASIENIISNGNNRLYLTLLGGGAFGNKMPWILDSISRAILLHCDSGLDISIVSYSRSKPQVQELVQMLTNEIRNRTT